MICFIALNRVVIRNAFGDQIFHNMAQKVESGDESEGQVECTSKTIE